MKLSKLIYETRKFKERGLTEQVLGIMFSAISILVFGVVLLVYSPLLFGIFCLFSLLYALWIRLFMARRRVLDVERFRAESLNSNCTYEFVTTMQENRRGGYGTESGAETTHTHCKGNLPQP